MPYSQLMSVSWLDETCIWSIDIESPELLHDIVGWSSRLPVMHLSWKLRLVWESRLLNEFEQLKPENELLPY